MTGAGVRRIVQAGRAVLEHVDDVVDRVGRIGRDDGQLGRASARSAESPEGVELGTEQHSAKVVERKVAGGIGDREANREVDVILVTSRRSPLEAHVKAFLDDAVEVGALAKVEDVVQPDARFRQVTAGARHGKSGEFGLVDVEEQGTKVRAGMARIGDVDRELNCPANFGSGDLNAGHSGQAEDDLPWASRMRHDLSPIVTPVSGRLNSTRQGPNQRLVPASATMRIARRRLLHSKR